MLTVAKKGKPLPAIYKGTAPAPSKGVGEPQSPEEIDKPMDLRSSERPTRPILKRPEPEELSRFRGFVRPQGPAAWPRGGIDAADPALTLYFGIKEEKIEEPKVDRSVNLKIRELRAAGRSWKDIAQELGLPWPTTA